MAMVKNGLYELLDKVSVKCILTPNCHTTVHKMVLGLKRFIRTPTTPLHSFQYLIFLNIVNHSTEGTQSYLSVWLLKVKVILTVTIFKYIGHLDYSIHLWPLAGISHTGGSSPSWIS